eukprot:gene6153-5997_t
MARVTMVVMALIGATGAVAGAAGTKVLFVGNSFTFVNDLPGTFEKVATSMGKQVTVDSSVLGALAAWARLLAGWPMALGLCAPTPYAAVFVMGTDAGGCSLQHLLTTNESQAKLQQEWDFIVLQDQSQLPSVQQARSAMLHPAVKGFVAQAKQAKVLMYSTWGYVQGLQHQVCPDNGTSACFPKSLSDYVPGCWKGHSDWLSEVDTYTGMTYALLRGYLSVKQTEASVGVAPWGAARQVARGLNNLGDEARKLVDGEYAWAPEASTCPFLPPS